VTVQTTASTLPAEIVALATRGRRLHPLVPVKRTPYMKGWPQLATCDLPQLERLAERYRGCGWGIATGPGSGVFVLDVDTEVGRASLLEWRRQGLDLPATFRVNTSRGWHCYFRWPKGRMVRNSASRIAPGLDIRGDRGYAVVPPSSHPSGVQYTFENLDQPVANAPGWLLEMVAEPERIHLAGSEIGILAEGERNDGLMRYAGALRRRGVGRELLEAKLREANLKRCRPPLADAEVSGIAVKAMRFEAGGPDPLQAAWQRIQGAIYPSLKAKFHALCEELQRGRANMPIVLPVQRIANLMGVSWQMASIYRRQLARDGVIELVETYVPHRRAGKYRVDGIATFSTKKVAAPKIEPVLSHPLPSLKEENSCTRGGEKQNPHWGRAAHEEQKPPPPEKQKPALALGSTCTSKYFKGLVQVGREKSTDRDTVSAARSKTQNSTIQTRQELALLDECYREAVRRVAESGRWLKCRSSKVNP